MQENKVLWEQFQWRADTDYRQCVSPTWSPEVSGTAVTMAMALAFVTTPGGGMVCLIWWADVSQGPFVPPQKAVVLAAQGNGVCVPPPGGRRKSTRGGFALLAVSNQGRAINESAWGQAGWLCALVQLSIKAFSISSAHLRS